MTRSSEELLAEAARLAKELSEKLHEAVDAESTARRGGDGRHEGWPCTDSHTCNIKWVTARRGCIELMSRTLLGVESSAKNPSKVVCHFLVELYREWWIKLDNGQAVRACGVLVRRSEDKVKVERRFFVSELDSPAELRLWGEALYNAGLWAEAERKRKREVTEVYDEEEQRGTAKVERQHR